MSLIVQKYGGTSVESPEKIRSVARRIQVLKKEGHDVIVVVSAMGHTTDELLRLSREVTLNPPQRELDMLLTAGERISMSLLAMALHEIHVPAISLTGSQSGIITTTQHGRAEIQSIRPIRIEEGLRTGKVVLVAGFQGVSAEKEVTTLGRGGSDTTAVALAAHFNAARCEILKDVEGVFTADPRIVSSAKLIPVCSLKDLHRMAILGNSVLHHRACELAYNRKMVLYVGHSEHSEFGTKVIPEESSGISVSAVMTQSSVNGLRIRKAKAALMKELKKFLQQEGGVVPFEKTDDEGVTIAFYDIAQERALTFLKDSGVDAINIKNQSGDLISLYGQSMLSRLADALEENQISALDVFVNPHDLGVIVSQGNAKKVQEIFHQMGAL